MFVKHQSHCLSRNTSFYPVSSLRLVEVIGASCSHWVDHELKCIRNEMDQWSEARQEIDIRLAETCKNQTFLMAQSRSRPQTSWNAVAGL